MKSYFLILLLFFATFLFAGDLFKPYILSDVNPDSVLSVLKSNNFEILGEYSPYKGAKIIVFTNEDLKNISAKSEHGIFGAVLRLAITGDKVSYTNPKYWGYAYRLKSDMKKIYKKVTDVLGNKKEFGSKKGLSEKKLRKYKYMIGMPKFDDIIKIKEFKDYKQAVKKVEQALKDKKILVYRLDLPNKNESLFGIKIKGENSGADRVVMRTLNSFTDGEKHTAYLPYEILVYNNAVYIFNGKFRIAISFPDLSMGQFMKIKSAPNNIKKYVKDLF